MKPKPIDWTKPVRTIKDHKRVYVITHQGRHASYPIMAYIGDSDCVVHMTVDGRLSSHMPPEVENAPEEVWLNIYPNNASEGDKFFITQHFSEAEAKLNRGPKCVGWTKIEVSS